MRADVTDELPLPAVVGLGQRVVVGTATLPEGTVLLLVLRLDVWRGTRRRRVDVQLTAALDIVAVLDPTPWSHARGLGRRGRRLVPLRAICARRAARRRHRLARGPGRHRDPAA